MTEALPYIPGHYRSLAAAGFTLWHAPAVPEPHLDQICEVIEGARRFCVHTLEFDPRRALHVCCFASNAETCRALDRQIHPAMALAPFSDHRAALIVIQSPAADRRNGDPDRMLRILAHEICHQYAAEVSGSQKILGDGNREMRIRAWLNEGLAEVVGNLAGERGTTLAEVSTRWRRDELPMTFAGLDRHLDDFQSPQRARAFDHATAAVHALAGQRPLRELFAELRQLDASFSGDQLCTPEMIERFCSQAASVRQSGAISAS